MDDFLQVSLLIYYISWGYIYMLHVGVLRGCAVSSFERCSVLGFRGIQMMHPWRASLEIVMREPL